MVSQNQNYRELFFLILFDDAWVDCFYTIWDGFTEFIRCAMVSLHSQVLRWFRCIHKFCHGFTVFKWPAVFRHAVANSCFYWWTLRFPGKSYMDALLNAGGCDWMPHPVPEPHRELIRANGDLLGFWWMRLDASPCPGTSARTDSCKWWSVGFLVDTAGAISSQHRIILHQEHKLVLCKTGMRDLMRVIW